jgi:hypothetical protein
VSAKPYTEDHLVEQPVIALFAELRWQTVSAMEEVFRSGGTLGRGGSVPDKLRAEGGAVLDARPGPYLSMTGGFRRSLKKQVLLKIEWLERTPARHPYSEVR